MLLKTGKNLKEMLGPEVVVNFDTKPEQPSYVRPSGPTTNKADVHFKLEVLLKQK